MKPRTREAMQALLYSIEQNLPLYAPESSICQNKCLGCPKKMMQFIEGEYEYWQQMLADEETPTLGDIQNLARSTKKIHKVLRSNGII